MLRAGTRVSMHASPPVSSGQRPFALQRLNEEERREFWACLALRHARGIGPRTCKHLLEHFGSAYAAVQGVRSWRETEARADQAAELASGSWRVTAKEEWERARRLDAEILLPTDPRLPQGLRELPDPPLLLYCRGDLNLLNAPCVAVVGARRCTEEGLSVTDAIASRLSACGVSVVSGLALGIDRQAHTSALRGPGRTIAVLGTGIDVAYPESNAGLMERIAREGLVVSEFMPASPPEAKHFPIRNRLISGLSLGVLVVEAAKRSGSLITARLALEQNRDVYAVPGSALAELSEGCRDLIRRGARVVFSADDVLIDLAPRLAVYGLEPETAFSPPDETATPPAPRKNALVRKKSKKPVREQPVESVLPQAELSGDEARVEKFLQEEGPCHIDMLSRRLDLPAARLGALLTQLEITSMVRRLPGAFYEAARAAAVSGVSAFDTDSKSD